MFYFLVSTPCQTCIMLSTTASLMPKWHSSPPCTMPGKMVSSSLLLPLHPSTRDSSPLCSMMAAPPSQPPAPGYDINTVFFYRPAKRGRKLMFKKKIIAPSQMAARVNTQASRRPGLGLEF